MISSADILKEQHSRDFYGSMFFIIDFVKEKVKFSPKKIIKLENEREREKEKQNQLDNHYLGSFFLDRENKDKLRHVFFHLI